MADRSAMMSSSSSSGGGCDEGMRRRIFVPWKRALLRATVGTVTIASWAQIGADAGRCVLANGDTQVTIGSPTAVCLVANPLVWQVIDEGEGVEFYAQVLITPDADEFSRFSVSGSWQNSVNGESATDNDVIDPILTTFGNDVGVHVESNGKFSYQKAFRRLDRERTFPVFTAIITVDEGEVTGITWDDGCHFCSSNSCEENTYDYDGELITGSGKDCYWNDSECPSESGDGVSSLCQLTVYVVWTGTDSKGNYFTSFAKRLSMYAGEGLESYMDKVTDTYEVIEDR